MEAEFDPTQLFQVMTSMRGGGRDVQADFEHLTTEEKNLFVYSRLLKLLANIKIDMTSYKAGNELDGLNYQLEHTSLYVSNLLNAVHFLGGALSISKRDVDMPELEAGLGATNPEDEAALSLIKIPFEWQQEKNGEIIKTDISLWDTTSEWLDVNNIRRFEMFVAGDETVVREVLNEYFPPNYPNRLKKIEEHFDAIVSGDETVNENGKEIIYLRNGNKIIARDLAFDAIMMRKVLKHALGLEENEQFPGLPEYTSLTTPIGFPVENLKYVGGVTDPEGTETSYLWNALGPFIFAAEAFSGVTGDYQIIRQDISPWLAMQSHRGFITPETYELDAYNTTSYLASDILNMTVIYDALLHRSAGQGMEDAAVRVKLIDSVSGKERRLTKGEVNQIKEIVTMPVLFDPRGLDYLVSQEKIENMASFLNKVRKMNPREPNQDKIERRARPIGTWGRVARAYVDSHSNLFLPESQGGEGLFENVDFMPWMKELGIKGKELQKILSRKSNPGGSIGKEGLITLIKNSGMRVMNIPYIPRMLRNWFHYAKSVDATITGNIKPAMELAFQGNISDVMLQRAVDNKPLKPGTVFKDRQSKAVIQIERDSMQLVSAATAKMSDPQNAPAYRFKEGPEMTSYIIQQSLLAVIQSHLVYPTKDTSWMDTPQLKELRKSIPSVGYLVEPDWDDFISSGGKQIRPLRITKERLKQIAISKGETFEQREKELLDQGFYWMPFGKGKKTREILVSPIRQPVRRLATIQEFMDGLGKSVKEIRKQAFASGHIDPEDEVVKKINRLNSLIEGDTFSPVHLQGIYAYPGEAWRIALAEFEKTGSGTPFLEPGSLDVIRFMITQYERTGILPKRFTTIRRYELIQNRISLEALEQGKKEIKKHLLRRKGDFNLPPDPLIAQLAPEHLVVE